MGKIKKMLVRNKSNEKKGKNRGKIMTTFSLRKKKLNISVE